MDKREEKYLKSRQAYLKEQKKEYKKRFKRYGLGILFVMFIIILLLVQFYYFGVSEAKKDILSPLFTILISLGILKGFDMLFQCEMKVNDLDGEIHDVGFKLEAYTKEISSKSKKHQDN
ncbi:hypothetical protein KBX49_11885 [Liquorilactobacillus satsumensis]|uniref:hypothetical protein n=1 Tax=Liquorilactobacillus satsumensis TaxID=259059 RepID=UPI0021C36DF7|nr:hypothetical protein [Liquorilactobacillus satsumensis]MCP9358637.1 hypothetical protein [Liquorilactobacillus satsumensis]MCP9372590.1 hypothetical protein [Liquorilactobacillus satsumensis]